VNNFLTVLYLTVDNFIYNISFIHKSIHDLQITVFGLTNRKSWALASVKTIGDASKSTCSHNCSCATDYE